MKIWAFGTKIGGNWWKRLGETGGNNNKQQQQPFIIDNTNPLLTSILVIIHVNYELRWGVLGILLRN